MVTFPYLFAKTICNTVNSAARKATTALRKNYISEPSNNLAGGVYCFDNMANAKNWFDEERIDWITNRYSKPDLKFYENPVTVDNNSDEIIS